MKPPFEFVLNHPRPHAKVSVILLDWNVRESFHALHYLNRQTARRDDFELIWVEFYERRPAALERMVHALGTDQPLLDKWVVLNYPPDVYFHKHFMYNVGLVLAQGDICVICDSDAMFGAGFIERVVRAFREVPDRVVHLDQIRNNSRRYYPFNYPDFAELLGDGCANWKGSVTKGLADSPDILHEANYGACMCARRDDLLAVGGADEHLDYLGYVCGPYDLTFRLANYGRPEHWLRDEYLFHAWHPGQSGVNFEYQGPNDGRGVSSRALAARDTGRIEPWVENAAIAHLRRDPATPQAELVRWLNDQDGAVWRETARAFNAKEKVELMVADYQGYGLYRHQGIWYALAHAEGAFDPAKAHHLAYKKYCLGNTEQEVREAVASRVAERGSLGRMWDRWRGGRFRRQAVGQWPATKAA